MLESLAEDATHLADLLHGLDKILLHSHIVTSKCECVKFLLFPVRNRSISGACGILPRFFRFLPSFRASYLFFASGKRSAADAGQHLAIVSHGLDQVLHHIVLHKIIPPKNEW